MQLGDRGEWRSAEKSSVPEIAGDCGEIVAIGNRRVLIGVSSFRALAGHMLFAAHLDYLHDAACLKASPQARERHGLPCPKGNEYGQETGCWMLLHWWSV